MKVILEASDKVMLKLINELTLKFRRNGIKCKKYVEPVKRTRKPKPVEVIQEIKEVPIEKIIENEKKEVKKRNPRAKRKAKN
jgi:hypothetical protein